MEKGLSEVDGEDTIEVRAAPEAAPSTTKRTRVATEIEYFMIGFNRVDLSKSVCLSGHF